MMLFVLHKYIVSNLGVSAAVASGLTVGSAGSLCIVDKEHLGVGSAGSVLKSPPVIFSGKEVDILLLKSGLFTVHSAFFISGGILVSGKYCSCKVIGVKSEYVCKKLKAPFATVFLEIISEAPASHHLEESKMALVAYGINIICTNTSLDIAKSCSLGMLLAEKIRHKGLHSGYVEHNACRTVGYQRNSSNVNMSALLVEVKPCISQLVVSKLFHYDYDLSNICLLSCLKS